MNPDWQTFLLERGAVQQDRTTLHFDKSTHTQELVATLSDTVLCDLDQFGTLRISGEDSQSFLQNLLSNDIREISDSRAQFSSLNSAKGRMLATMMIFRDGDDYLLQLPSTLIEPIHKKLGMYILRAKVSISDASNEVISLGISGANAQRILSMQFDDLPQNQFDSTSNALASVIKIGDTRYQINASVDNAITLWKALSQHAQPVSSACWDWLNIRAGMPVILPQTQEQLVAQMANLDLIGGVNFKKGCYPGQEIVARMQYLGKLKRRTYLAHIDSSVPPRPGDELFSADMEGQAIGMIINVASAPAGGYDLLAAMQSSSREKQTVHWKSLQGATLQFMTPPYPLEGA